MNRKKLKRKNIFQLLLIVAGIVLINILAGIQFFRLDLTVENRYTLADGTKETLRELDDIVYIRVFLEGELPSDLIRFRQSIEEKLRDFEAYAGKNLEYEFVNLYDTEDAALRNQMMQELAEKGLKITDIKLRDKEGGISTKLIFPGALVTFRGIEFPVNLLKNNPAFPYQVNLNNSIQSLEYEFIKAIRSLTKEEIEQIAFIRGQNELDFLQTYDIGKELSLFFDVKWEWLNGDLEKIMENKALIIAQPLAPFTEKDKFVLDQYVMNGGNILFFLDPVQSNVDSLITGRTFTSFLNLNIYDLLFKYGFRIDYNLIKDLQCSYVRVQTSVNEQNPQMALLPWYYFPLLSAPRDHFLTTGLNYVKTEFVSAVDTTPAPMQGVERTVLLSSSDSSALITNPVYITMDEITAPPDLRVFDDSNIPVAVLAKGRFNSFFTNYGIPEGVNMGEYGFKKESEPAMIFVAGDGDMIKNEVRVTPTDTIPLALGYDKDTRQTFGNKEFIMNVINYMTDDEGLIALRAREFKLRLLDRARIRLSSVRLKWQLINVFVPVGLVLLSGGIFASVRRKRYGRKKF